MYQRIIMGILFLTMLQSCTSKTEMHKEFDENGILIEEYTRNKENFAKEGLYKSYYPGGKSVMEMKTFVNNIANGDEIMFFENGDTLSVKKVVNGIYEGYYREYAETGHLILDYNHTNGAINGSFKQYFPETGALKEELSFKNNNEHGPFKEYHPNGKVAVEGIYDDGVELGELLEFDDSGTLVKKKKCELVSMAGERKSICTTTWEKE